LEHSAIIVLFENVWERKFKAVAQSMAAPGQSEAYHIRGPGKGGERLGRRRRVAMNLDRGLGFAARSFNHALGEER
jgi:hypothetical protein